MQKVGRAVIAGIVILVGCADTTFDLLPKAGSGLTDETGQSGDTGAGDATGTGSVGGKGGSGGSAAMSEGGNGNDPGCGPSGCVPSGCKPEDGCCLSNDDCAAPTPYCGASQHRCVNCRAYFDCVGENCSHDCLAGEICDYATSMCAPTCNNTSKPCSTSFLRVCEPMRQVCVECEPNDHPGAIRCDHDLKCNLAGECVECLSAYDCQDDAKPVCSFPASRCVPCQKDDECNPGSHPPGFVPRTCDEAGHCVAPPPPPAE